MVEKKHAKRFAEGDEKIAFGKPNTVEVGSSGTSLAGGSFGEEELLDLQGPKAAEIYEKMKRRESQVSMLLNAIKNPIISANWSFHIEDEADPIQQKMKELCEWNFEHGLIDGMGQHLREALSLIDKGFVVFECVHGVGKVPELDGQQVTYYKKFGFRKQSTIHKWQLEKKTGKLLGVVQTATGDVPEDTYVTIPGEFLLVISNQREGDNYEGISALRAMYGAYSRKDLYLKLTAVGSERFAIGTVIGTTPKSKTTTAEEDAFEATLAAYSANDSSYIKIPEGWKVEIAKADFDPAKMVSLLNFENEEMARAVVASFLLLGNGGNGGAYSLGSDLSDFFLGGIQSYADLICEAHNSKTIPGLCQLNFGEQPCYPELRCTGINDKAGKELAEIVLSLKNSGNLTPDDKLEDFLRKQYKLPEADPTTARNTQPQAIDPATGQPIPTPPSDPNADPVPPTDPKPPTDKQPVPKDAPADQTKLAEIVQDKVVLGESYKAQFNASKEGMKAIMQQHLRLMADDLKAQLARAWNAAGEATKDSIVKGVSVRPGLLNAYKKDLRNKLAEIATAAIGQARKEVPSASRVKFFDYDKLNPLVKRSIEAQLYTLATTQSADIEKLVLFQWGSSASSRTELAGILQDVEEKAAAVIDGLQAGGMSIDVAAGDATAWVTQNSRNSFFFEPEVLDTLESFTFTNEDPVSEICQNLNGQTFLVSDPAAEAYYPPLHHNCKSRLVPNEKGDGAKVTGIGITAPNTDERLRLEKQITLGCGC
jgi:hypothetical protein